MGDYMVCWHLRGGKRRLCSQVSMKYIPYFLPVFKMPVLSLPVKPPSRSFLEAAESSKLLDWELDSIKTEREETVARSLFHYRNLKAEMKNQCEISSHLQEDMDESSSYEPKTVWVMGSWGALDSLEGKREESKEYMKRVAQLSREILTLKIQILCVKIAHVSTVIRQLQELETSDGPKTITPPELLFQKFEEWVQSNEQIYNLQSSILDLEAQKVRLHKSIRTEHGRRLSVSSIATKGSFASVLEDHPGKNTESELMHQFVDEPMVSHIPSKQEAMLDKLLAVSSQNKSFESFKLKAYIRECWEVNHVDDDFPTGVHADRYQEFIGGMCQYIVDKPAYGFLSYDVVFAKLEHHLMPEIYSRVQEHISRPEDDAKLARFSKNFAFLSQSQYGIKPECQDISLSPYFAAISALKASAMCLIPTRKIFQIVRAAKLVFENLNEIAEQDNRSPPGADEFMDVWVYVVLKANIPRLASTVAYLKKYCNPNLAFTEAGYYLSSVEFACQYLLRLNEHEFPVHQGEKIDKIVICEQRRYRQLTSERGPLFEIVSENEWLKGYKLFAVKEWQLDPLRYFCTVLVPTDDQSAKVKVSVVRVNKEVVSASQLEYLKSCFLELSAAHGLASIDTPLGRTVVLYPTNAQRSLTLIPIKSGQYDKVEDSLKWYCTLERLSCIQQRNQSIRNITENTAADTGLHKSEDTKRKVEIQGLSSEFSLLDLNDEHSEHESTFKDPRGTTCTDDVEKKEAMDIISTDFVLDAAQHRDALVQSVYHNSEEKHTADHLMTVLVNFLYILGYLSPLIDIPGPYFNNVIVLAVRQFQLDYNSYSPPVACSALGLEQDTLPTSGHLTPATLKALKDILRKSIENLNKLGFSFEGKLHLNQEKEWMEFSKFIGRCQDSMAINIHIKGALDKQTREEIERLVADL